VGEEKYSIIVLFNNNTIRYTDNTMEFIKLIGVGLVLGITMVTPGVSVGTMAVVFNVYYRLIEVITPNIKKIIGAWKFWLPLGVGLGAGVIAFSKIITILFNHHPIPTYWFFIGIIAGCIPQVYRRIKRPDSALPALSPSICCLCALAVIVLMAVFTPAEGAAVYTEITPQLFAMLVAGGVLAAVAMIIPGISGTFLLLVIGLYRTFVQAVSSFNIPLLAPVMLGAVAGLFVGAAAVRLLLAKAPGQTYGAVLGLVAGSIFVLFPGGMGDGTTILFSIAAVLVGGTISFFLGRKSDLE
jgi:putative membrane protein